MEGGDLGGGDLGGGDLGGGDLGGGNLGGSDLGGGDLGAELSAGLSLSPPLVLTKSFMSATKISQIVEWLKGV